MPYMHDIGELLSILQDDQKQRREILHLFRGKPEQQRADTSPTTGKDEDSYREVGRKSWLAWK
jgi:hypothetical protein